MGLDINGIQCILHAKSLGVEFSRMAMIGRQGLHMRPRELKTILVNFGFSLSDDIIGHMFSDTNGYAEEFFRYLGADIIHSFDISDYEKATHVHDMNQDIPECFKQQYSAVLDAGSLEHVFNFPVAIKNCMEMVQVGGHYVGITPANNFMGHGFYQFSPELFFSIFTGENGYELIRIMAFENCPKARWFSVKSPVSAHGRVTLINSKPVYLLIVAKRIKNLAPLTSNPQQSDYVTLWNKKSGTINASLLMEVDRNVRRHHRFLAMALSYMPFSIKRVVKYLIGYDREQSGFNPRYFQPMDRTGDMISPKKYE